MPEYLTPSGDVYTAVKPLHPDDTLVPNKPSVDGEWFFHTKLLEWLPSRRDQNKGAEVERRRESVPVEEEHRTPPPRRVNVPVVGAPSTTPAAHTCPYEEGHCPIGNEPHSCPQPVVDACVDAVIKEDIQMLHGFGRRATAKAEGHTNPPSHGNGFSWNIKELIPLLITILGFLAGGVAAYTNLSNDILIAKQDITYMKTEQSNVDKKLGELVKSNESIKNQLEDLRLTIMVSMKGKS